VLSRNQRQPARFSAISQASSLSFFKNATYRSSLLKLSAGDPFSW